MIAAKSNDLVKNLISSLKERLTTIAESALSKPHGRVGTHKVASKDKIFQFVGKFLPQGTLKHISPQIG